VILDTGEVTNTAPAYRDDGEFLQIMTFAADIRCNFLAVGKADAGNLSPRPAVDKVIIAVNFDSPGTIHRLVQRTEAQPGSPAPR
jgi:hypothetical protein